MNIYLEQDEYPYNEFDFEISLIDLICEDEIRLTDQLDKQKKLERTIKEECSWQGYEDILNGVRSFLSQPNFRACLDGDVYLDKDGLREEMRWKTDKVGRKGR